MPRKYDCQVKFYASWFDDLRDKDKGFTNAEVGQILLCIADAQLKGDADELDKLPAVIKRGLQMATLKEQVTRIIERTERCRERGKRGGDKAQENKRIEEMREKELQRLRKVKETQLWNDNKQFWKRVAKSEQVDYLVWMRTKKTDAYLRKLQALDEPYRGVDFEVWKKLRGFAYEEK